MKNIHTIPTNEPSRLHKAFDKTFILSNELTGESDLYKSNPYHLYITSGETAKHGNLCIAKTGIIVIFKGGYDPLLYKKIVLTTDPKLISQVIQAIDEDFLQWFVDNQTVEYVEALHIHANVYKLLPPPPPPTTFEPVEQPNKETIQQMARRIWNVNRVGQLAFIDGATHVQEQIPSIIKQFLSQHQNDYLLNHVDEWCRENIK